MRLCQSDFVASLLSFEQKDKAFSGIPWNGRLPAERAGGRLGPSTCLLLAVLVALLALPGVGLAQAVSPNATWVQASPATSPSNGGAMAYDPANGTVVLFVGYNGGPTSTPETWTWNGTTWTQKSPATSPPARTGAAMAYDATTETIVLFGGFSNGSVLSDTWTWNGTTWTQQSPANSPPARTGANIAYDAATDTIVLFGGSVNSSTFLGDTWTWNGTTWTQQSPANSPDPREFSTMAYDEATGTIVLFGGYDFTFKADTWIWNGTTWVEQSPPTNPPARVGAATAYDAALGTVVLFSGEGGTGALLEDTWTWNGTTWTQQSSATSPSPADPAAMAYDAATGTVLVFGVSATWNYQLSLSFGSVAVGSSTSATASFSVTTAGTLGTPVVLTQGAPNQDFTLGSGSTCTGAVSTGNCVVAVNFSPKYPGLRMGAVEVVDGGGNVLATTHLQGVGTGPEVTFTPGTISTVAGNGTACSNATASPACGDTGPATSGEFNYPSDAVVDGMGNLYIADPGDNRVRKVTAATGILSTVAGTGTAGYVAAQDGGPAASAELSNPGGVAVDGVGNLYIADSYNSLIRKVTAAGIISTVAGNGDSGYVPSQDGGPATSAELYAPKGVAVDGVGNIYIADTGNNLVRKVTAGGVITTVAGNGSQCSTSSTTGCGDGGPATSAELFTPSGVAVDTAGNLYIADEYDQRVREVSAISGVITTIAGTGTAGYSPSQDGGPATSAQLTYPAGVSVDAGGDVYIADSYNNFIRKVTAASGIISTIAGGNGPFQDGGPATTADLSQPVGVTVDAAGNLYIADQGNVRIRKITATAAPLIFATTNVGSTSTDSPQTLTLNNIGNAALTFPIPTATGATNPSISADFTTGNSSTPCPQLTTSSSNAGTLTAGSSCTDAITFSPTTGGSMTEQLVFTDTSLNANPSTTQTVQLMGTANFVAPTVTTISPASGPVAGGTTVTITGTDFNGATGVSFGATATSFTIVSNTSITATAPAGAGAGIVDVTVTNPGGTSATSAADRFTYVAQVSAANSTLAASPSPAVAGSSVTVTATVEDASGNAIGGATVTFGQTTAGGAASGTASFSNVTMTNASGVATATLSDTAAETLTLSATVTGTGTGSLSTATEQFVVPAFVVTVTSDPASGAPSNCVDPNVSSSGNANCALRDAIAATNALNATGTITISFASGLASVNSPATITLANGQLALSNTTSAGLVIQGPGAAALSISGDSASGVFYVAPNVTAFLSGLTITKASSSTGALDNYGTVTLSNCTVSGNTSSYAAGGIYNVGTLTLNNSIVSGNTAGYGGGIYNYSTLTLSNSTVSGNSASSEGGGISNAGTMSVNNSTVSGNTVVDAGGGIYNYGTSTLNHSTVSGNTTSSSDAGFGGGVFNTGSLLLSNSVLAGNSSAVQYADIEDNGGSVTNNGGNIYSTNPSGTSTINPKLAPLGNYAGTTPTMLPLPGSPAICAGVAVTGVTTDQRGVALSGARYGQTSCYDAGSVQTEYSLGTAFTTQPPSIVYPGQPITPNPAVTVTENGGGIGGATVTMSAASGTLSGTTSATSAAGTGVATFTNLKIGGAQPGDDLIATLTLNAATTPVVALTLTSSTFNSMTVSAPPTLTGTVGVAYSQTVTATNGIAPYTYQVTSGALPAGLTIDSGSGAITGAPTAGGSFPVTVTATDSSGGTASTTFTLVIASPTIVVSPGTLPALAVGTPVSTSLTASGGTSPYGFALTSGGLPAGLMLNPSTGVISGTPTTAGAYSFTVSATDSSGGTGPYNGSQSYSGQVGAESATVTFTASTLSQSYTGTPRAVTATTNPSGLALTYSYVGTGATTYAASATPPTSAGTYNVTATVTNPSYHGSAGPTAFTIVASPTISEVFAPASVAPNAISTVGFTLGNSNGSTVSLTDVEFTDVLPAGLVVSTPSRVETTCSGGRVSASAGGGSISLSGATIAGGSNCTVTVQVTSPTVGNYTNTTSAATSANGGTGTTAMASLTVVVTPTTLVYTAAPGSPTGAGGDAGTVLVALEDASGDIATNNSTSTVTLTIAGPSSYNQTYVATATNGVATFNLSSVPLTVAGTYIYTAASTGLNSTQTNEVITGGTAALFTVTGLGTMGAPGEAGTITVTALDAYGNVATGFTGTVAFASSDPQATLPAPYTFVPSNDGTNTFSITLNTAGLQSVTATSGAVTGSETGIQVNDAIWILNANGTVTRLSDTGAPSTTTGSASGTASRGGVAFDHTGDVWAVDSASNNVLEFSHLGSPIPVPGSSAAGVNAPMSVFVDGIGEVWIANGNNSVSVLNSGGGAVTPSTGYQGGGISAPTAIMIDGSGSVWLTNSGNNSVTKIIGGAAPVVAPTAAATTNNQLGTRP